jgi:thioredoxin-related protein
LPAKKFGLNKTKRLWYDFAVKQNLLVFFFISTAFLAGCSGQELTIDMSKIVTDTNAPPVNLSAEIARAKSENKLLLLEFGSSDSCPPCILFQQKVFSSPEFKAYEKTNLDFVRLDFPQRTQLLPATQSTNILLAQQFNAYAFPTFVTLDKDGKEFWRQEGAQVEQFNPTNFINLLEEVKKKEK